MKKFLIFLLVLANISFGQENKKSEPVIINADKLEYNNKERVAIYTGNVDVKKGNMQLKADIVKIFLDEKSDVSRILAIGNVWFQKEDKWGKAKEGEYIKSQDIIILRGDAELHQADNVVEGDEIRYIISEEKSFVDKKTKRVRTIFFSKEKTDEKENKQSK